MDVAQHRFIGSAFTPEGDELSLYSVSGLNVWHENGEPIAITQAKSRYPVEYQLITGLHKIKKASNMQGQLAKKQQQMGMKILEDASNDSQCEVKWKHRPMAIETWRYLEPLGSI